MADAGGGDASHACDDADALELVVGNGGSEAADDDDTDAAVGRLESLLHAATGNRMTEAQASTANRPEWAIGAVLHRR
jgi:hypothetical protein